VILNLFIFMIDLIVFFILKSNLREIVMSRLAKKPLAVPSNVKFSYTQEGNFYKFDVKGPKGNITKLIRNDVEIKQGKDGLIFTLKGNDNAKKPMIGTTYRIVNSMIEGVVNGFSKTLVLYGVGFKASIKGKNLELEIGYSHTISFPIPDGIEIKIDQQKLIFSSVDKELLGMTVQKVRDLRKPDVYKGKGFRFENENPVTKTGKKTGTK